MLHCSLGYYDNVFGWGSLIMMTFSFLSMYLSGVIASLVCLWLAGDRVVRYAVELATALRVTKFFIGFIVLAIVAGIPELAVAFAAAFTGASQVAAGDVIGANFSDVTLVSGLVFILAGNFTFKNSDRMKLIRMLMITGGVMAFVFWLGSVGKLLGLTLVVFYGVALFFIWRRQEKSDIWHEEVKAVTHDIAASKDVVLTSVVGIVVKLSLSVVVVLGCSWLTVQCAVALASCFGAQLETVGATICALGTSLPELAMGFSGLRRKEYELALAPTLGSILEHSTLVLGVLGLFSPNPVSFANLRGAGAFMFIGFAMMIVALKWARAFKRWHGVVLLALYVVYLAYEFGWFLRV